MLIIGKLTTLKVAREKRPGMYGDGGGLCWRPGSGWNSAWRDLR